MDAHWTWIIWVWIIVAPVVAFIALSGQGFRRPQDSGAAHPTDESKTPPPPP
jgi:hypothetical protein